MRVYIAGPMTKFKEKSYNFPEFYKAQGLLEMLGHTCANPARMDLESGKAAYSPSEGRIVTAKDFTLADAMRRDIKEIADCDGIVLLPDWQSSTGAAMELHVAQKIFMLPVWELVIDPTGWPLLKEVVE